MNNEQFRRLLVDASSSPKSGEKPSSSPRNAKAGGATPGAMLGSRMRSSIPMTPRSVTGVDFAKQLAEHRREGDQRPAKRFKSSAAPKGSKLPTGYQDRAQLRNTEADGEDDLQKRIKALEDMVKLGQIDQATFNKICSELGVGGDTSSTHMVKGLDWELLKRVRAGEDISKAPEKPVPTATDEPPIAEEDIDEAFERVMDEKGQEEIKAKPKEKKEKKGNMAPPPPRTRTRDEILRELKASRAAAAAAKAPAPAPESTLGSKFKKVGDNKPEKKRFIESDENGRRREVLLITDANGNTKRKVRWLDKPDEPRGTPTLPMPDKSAKPLGMEVPADLAVRAAAGGHPEEEDDDDIFAGVGADYDPLAGIEQEDDSSSEEDSEEPGKTVKDSPPVSDSGKTQKPDETAAQPAKPRNYFAATTSAAAEEAEEADDRSNPLTKDPTIMAALKRAAALRQTSPSEGDSGLSPEASLRQKKFLEEARRRDALDAADLDMGFGGSRIEDDEDDEGVLLDFEGKQRGANKRKRGPKKKKGDKDSVDDVMRVLEGRKKSAA